MWQTFATHIPVVSWLELNRLKKMEKDQHLSSGRRMRVRLRKQPLITPMKTSHFSAIIRFLNNKCYEVHAIHDVTLCNTPCWLYNKYSVWTPSLLPAKTPCLTWRGLSADSRFNTHERAGMTVMYGITIASGLELDWTDWTPPLTSGQTLTGQINVRSSGLLVVSRHLGVPITVGPLG